jgi:hypothetical protein
MRVWVYYRNNAMRHAVINKDRMSPTPAVFVLLCCRSLIGELGVSRRVGKRPKKWKSSARNAE